MKCSELSLLHILWVFFLIKSVCTLEETLLVQECHRGGRGRLCDCVCGNRRQAPQSGRSAADTGCPRCSGCSPALSLCRVLIGSPLAGQPRNRTGDVYKCPVGRGEPSPCVKLHLPGMRSDSVPARAWIVPSAPLAENRFQPTQEDDPRDL